MMCRLQFPVYCNTCFRCIWICCSCLVCFSLDCLWNRDLCCFGLSCCFGCLGSGCSECWQCCFCWSLCLFCCFWGFFCFCWVPWMHLWIACCWANRRGGCWRQTWSCFFCRIFWPGCSDRCTQSFIFSVVGGRDERWQGGPTDAPPISTSTASCLMVILVESSSGETDEIWREPQEISGGSSLTFRKTLCSGAPLLSCSSCLLSTSTSLCFCFSILVSSAICLSFSHSILSLSAVTKGAAAVFAGDEAKQCFCRDTDFKERWVGVLVQQGGSFLMLAGCRATKEGWRLNSVGEQLWGDRKKNHF